MLPDRDKTRTRSMKWPCLPSSAPLTNIWDSTPISQKPLDELGGGLFRLETSCMALKGGNGLNPEACKWGKIQWSARSSLSRLYCIEGNIGQISSAQDYLSTSDNARPIFWTGHCSFPRSTHHSGSWKTWLGAICNFRRSVDISERCHVRTKPSSTKAWIRFPRTR